MPCSVPAAYTFLDQGALNQYYEAEIRGKPINRVSGSSSCLFAGGEWEQLAPAPACSASAACHPYPNLLQKFKVGIFMLV